MNDPIAGKRILVTRPVERAAGLAAAIEAAGGHAVLLPAIEIVPRSPDADAGQAARAADRLVFVSPAAVEHGIETLGLRPEDAPPIGVVGPGTAAALRERGFSRVIEPVGSADSEGLLRAPAFAPGEVAGRRVVIVRGQGGRAALSQGLMARGAAVDYAEVYWRARPRDSIDPRDATECDIVTATSSEGLTNLLAIFDAPARSALLTRPLAVIGARTAALARREGFTHAPEIAEQPGDTGLLAAIRRCATALSNPEHQNDRHPHE